MKSLQRGATTVEMTLVGIPIIFILISTFEMSRAMWNYHTLSNAVKEGVRYAIVHGQNCGTVGSPPLISNNCQVSSAGGPNPIGLRSVAQVIQDAGVGLDPDRTVLWFCAPAPTPASCASTTTPCALGSASTKWPQCSAVAVNPWPPPCCNQGGFNHIEIDIGTEFHSMAALFWPGAGGAATFGVVNFGASSIELMQF